ncbi:MAG: hypothetical protein ACYDH5_12420 [Acidimicrobiales bacterium]
MPGGPDNTCERASKRAQDLAITALGEPNDSAADAVSVGHRLLTDTADDW